MRCGDPAISLCCFASRADRFYAVSRMSPSRLGVPKGGDVMLVGVLVIGRFWLG